jgi:GNAT superfamily N-acetyltransferase
MIHQTNEDIARIEVLRVTSAQAALIARFVRAVWSPTATAETVAEARRSEAMANPASGGEEAPTFLVLSNGDPIGHLTTIPSRHWMNGAEHIVHWAKGLVVLPEYRNGPVGYLLLKEAVKQIDRTLATVVATPARRLFGALRFNDLGAVPNYIRLLDPVKVAKSLDVEALNLGGLPSWFPGILAMARRTGIYRLGGWAVRGTLALRSVPSTFRARGYETKAVARLSEVQGMDQLWNQLSTKIACGTVRDGRYFVWRYDRRPAGQYRAITITRRGTLRGLVMLKTPDGNDSDSRLKGIRVAMLSDMLYDPAEPGAGLAGLRAAAKQAREIGAHALLCSATAPVLKELLKARGFIRIPGSMHLLSRYPAGDPAPPSGLDQWWITRADGESDGV